MANFIPLTLASGGERVLINFDLVTAVFKRPTGARLYFLESEDGLDVTESQQDIYTRLTE